MSDLVNRLLRECWDKEIYFIHERHILKVKIEDETVFSGSEDSYEDHKMFMEADWGLADLYESKILEKVTEITGIQVFEAEYDADYQDYLDIYTPTLYAKKIISVKVGRLISERTWTWLPLKKVLEDVEKQLRRGSQ